MVIPDQAPIEIAVDDREPDTGVADALRASDQCRLVRSRLAVGDFDIDGRILVERKTLPDLVESIKDGRLFRQAARLAESGRWSALILEGTSRDLANSGMRREAIQGALVNVTLYLGIPLLRSAGPTETASLLLTIARQGHRYSQDGPVRPGRRPRGKRRLQLYLLQGLPGVGPHRAARLLDHFGTVEAVVKAAVPELCEVDGIGTAVAEGLRWAVREPSGNYLDESRGAWRADRGTAASVPPGRHRTSV